MVVCGIAGSFNRNTTVQADLGKKQDTISKNNNNNRAGGMAQVVECLLSKYQSSNPKTKTKPEFKSPVWSLLPHPTKAELVSSYPSLQ
jgi:hypothetical protein